MQTRGLCNPERRMVAAVAVVDSTLSHSFSMCHRHADIKRDENRVNLPSSEAGVSRYELDRTSYMNGLLGNKKSFRMRLRVTEVGLLSARERHPPPISRPSPAC